MIRGKEKIESWLRGPDLNRRPSGYEPDELPSCSTPRPNCCPLPDVFTITLPSSSSGCRCSIPETCAPAMPAKSWLRGPDLNRRPSGYEPDELPSCSTPRPNCCPLPDIFTITLPSSSSGCRCSIPETCAPAMPAKSWLRGPDLNRRPSGYEPDELPSCSTPRPNCCPLPDVFTITLPSSSSGCRCSIPETCAPAMPAKSWLRGPDLNRRPSGYEPDELPSCSTPRPNCCLLPDTFTITLPSSSSRCRCSIPETCAPAMPAKSWLRGPDLNRRPSGYEPDELPSCSTPRPNCCPLPDTFTITLPSSSSGCHCSIPETCTPAMPVKSWLRGPDLNRRPSGYEPDELPSCSTPRPRWPIIGSIPNIASKNLEKVECVY